MKLAKMRFPKLQCMTGYVLIVLVYMADGFLNIEELNQMKYNVDIVRTPVNSQEINMVDGLPLKSLNGQQYFCKLPKESLELSKSSEEIEEKNKLDSPAPLASLVNPLMAKPCLTKVKGWWTYELCPGKSIRQFHLEADESKGDVVSLGIFSHEFDWGNRTMNNPEAYLQHKTNRYHSQTYLNGTECDLVKIQRSTEVRYKCDENSPETYIEYVDEPSTCSYVITVRTPLICNHPYTRPPPSNKPHDIVCQPLLKPDDYSSYMEEMKNAPPEEDISKGLDTNDKAPYEGMKSKVYVYYTTIDEKAGTMQPITMSMVQMPGPTWPKKNAAIGKQETDQPTKPKDVRSEFHRAVDEAMALKDEQLGLDSASIKDDIDTFSTYARQALPMFMNNDGADGAIKKFEQEMNAKLQKQVEEANEKLEALKMYKDIAIKMIDNAATGEKLLELKDSEKVLLVKEITWRMNQKNPTADMARDVHSYIIKFLLTASILDGKKYIDKSTMMPTVKISVDMKLNEDNEITSSSDQYLDQANSKLEKELKKIENGDGNMDAHTDDEMMWWDKEGSMFKDLLFDLLSGEEAKRKEELRHKEQNNNYNFRYDKSAKLSDKNSDNNDLNNNRDDDIIIEKKSDS